MIFNVYKQRGETPLECIGRFREKLKQENASLGADEKMTYLGRLDPLAEGVMLIGTGKETEQKRREEFFNLDKEYDFVALFGFATDSYDIMGKILKTEKVDDLPELDLIKVVKLYEGKREQKYPFYSSKIISSNKVSSFEDAEEAEGPSKEINIHEIKFKKLESLRSKELFGRILMDVSRVKGDFRQAEILALWQKKLLGEKTNEGEKWLGHFSAKVSSGTYIRSLVNDIGNTLGIGATTLSIKRTRVGDYKIEDSLKF